MRPLNVLLLVSAHNNLSQCSSMALTELGHDVEVGVVKSGASAPFTPVGTPEQLKRLRAYRNEELVRSYRCAVQTPAAPPRSAAMRPARAR